MLTINSKQYDEFINKSLLIASKELNFNLEKIAVEIDKEIISKSDYENFILKDNQKVEVVTFVRGG